MFSFFLRKARRPVMKSHNASKSFRPQIEALEDRWMPSGGILDPTFGTGGVVTTQVASTSAALALATGPSDGKVVMAGYADMGTKNTVDYDFAVVRYNLDGTLDKTFGGSGKVTTAFGGASDDIAYAVTVLPNGKILAAGRTSNDFALARYNIDGTLDKTFGGKGTGRVATDFNQHSTDLGLSMIVQPDGKIVVAGMTTPQNQNSNTIADLALVRYNSDGSLDTSFGVGGKASSRFALPISYQVSGDSVSVALDRGAGPLDLNTGKIVVEVALAGSYVGVARYNTNGSPDTSFGGGTGYTYVTTINGREPASVVVQTDDRIVLSGRSLTDSGIAVVRLNSDGTPDASFGSGGLIDITPSTEFYNPGSMTIQSDGKILLSAGYNNGTVVARLNSADGQLDTSFGVQGIASCSAPYLARAEIALEPDGRIVVGGVGQMAAVRFLATGPQIGSLSANPSPVTAGANLTLTASNISDANPGATITQVAFYADSNGDGVLDSGDALLGYGSQTAPGTWSFTFSTAGMASGTFAVFAMAEDSYGAFGDPLATTETVI